MGPILLLDTYSLVFRAHHALPPMNTRAGEPTSALYGFSALLLKLLREHRPRALAFALDAKEKTFRHDAYDEYKAGRERAPSSLVVQLRRLEDMLCGLGVPAHRVPGFEADDVLATLAVRARAHDEPSVVVSGDRDLLQVAAEGCRVLFVGRRGKDAVLYDRQAVEERFGVPAERLPMYVALVGDTSDHLEGVKGVGPKTAAAWVNAFGSVAGLFDRMVELPERARTVLTEHRDRLVRNEELARLRTDVPLASASPLWAWPTTEGFAALRTTFNELEFSSLLPRLDAIEATAR